MEAVIMSIQPQGVEKMANGEKTVDVRKTRPKINTPFKCYIYCTKAHKLRIVDSMFAYWDDDLAIIHTPYGVEIRNPYGSLGKDDELLNGKIVGEFICDKIERFDLPMPAYFSQVPNNIKELLEKSCLSMTKAHHYIDDRDGYGWHISDLKIYDKPRELSEFYTNCEGGNEIRCRKCIANIGKSFCETHLKKPITRPPQSWCYVKGEEYDKFRMGSIDGFGNLLGMVDSKM